MIRKLAIALILALAFTACDDKPPVYKIRLWACDGRLIGDWETIGTVTHAGPAFQFYENGTKIYKEVSGIVTIEEIRR